MVAVEVDIPFSSTPFPPIPQEEFSMASALPLSPAFDEGLDSVESSSGKQLPSTSAVAANSGIAAVPPCSPPATTSGGVTLFSRLSAALSETLGNPLGRTQSASSLFRFLSGGTFPDSPRSPGEPLLPPQRHQDKGKLTVVLDLDETMAFARTGRIHPRPHLDTLLSLLGSHCETVVWTASAKAYARPVLETLDNRLHAVRYCICRRDKHYQLQMTDMGARPIKDLTFLGRDLSRTILIDNSPECLGRSPSNSVLMPDFTGSNPSDCALLTLINILTELIHTTESVETYLARSLHVRQVSVSPNPLLPVPTIPSSATPTVLYMANASPSLPSSGPSGFLPRAPAQLPPLPLASEVPSPVAQNNSSSLSAADSVGVNQAAATGSGPIPIAVVAPPKGGEEGWRTFELWP